MVFLTGPAIGFTLIVLAAVFRNVEADLCAAIGTKFAVAVLVLLAASGLPRSALLWRLRRLRLYGGMSVCWVRFIFCRVDTVFLILIADIDGMAGRRTSSVELLSSPKHTLDGFLPDCRVVKVRNQIGHDKGLLELLDEIRGLTAWPF